MSVTIKTGRENLEGIKRGVDMVANTVKSTMGAKGRNVIYRNILNQVVITNDGVTVAKEIELKGGLESIGGQIVKDVAVKTNDMAGDGTTTATVLTQSLFSEGCRYITSGSNPLEIKEGIDMGVEVVVKNLKNMAEPVNDVMIKQIATISANNDQEVGELISGIIKKIGRDGNIKIEEGNGTKTTVDVVGGMDFNRGYVSQHFITNKEKNTVELSDASVLVIDNKISNLKNILEILEAVSNSGKSLLIICEDIDEEPLSALAYNKLTGMLKVAVVKSPEFGDKKRPILEDIAMMTGAEIIDDFSNPSIDVLGTCSKVVIDKDKTLLVEGGNKENLTSYVNSLKAQMENSDSDKSWFEERIGKLSGGVAIIYVGGTSELEMTERKFRIEDAVHATKAAIQEGVIPGGGTGLLNASEKLNNLISEASLPEDVRFGIKCVYETAMQPIKTIVGNAKESGDVVISEIRKKNKEGWGFDVKDNKYKDMYKAGIVDPVKVARVALENSASIVGLILTAECSLLKEE